MEMRSDLLLDRPISPLYSEPRAQKKRSKKDQRLKLPDSARKEPHVMYQLAQVNIARMLAPLTEPLMAGFVAQLDAINALADSSPGFLWRLQTPEGNATALRPFEDYLILVNLSLWASLADLSTFVYKSP